MPKISLTLAAVNHEVMKRQAVGLGRIADRALSTPLWLEFSCFLTSLIISDSEVKKLYQGPVRQVFFSARNWAFNSAHTARSSIKFEERVGPVWPAA